MGTMLLARVISELKRTRVIVILWIVVVAYAVRFSLKLPPTFNDFNQYYVGAFSLRLGSNPYSTKYDVLASSLGLNVSIYDLQNQTPTFLLFFEPLTMLSFRVAYWTWLGLSLVWFLVALFLVLRIGTSLDARESCLFGAFVFLYPPVYEHFFFANAQTMILMLIVVAMCCLHREWNFWAGLAFATATALKAYPWVFAIYLISRRRWHALLWMVLGTVTLGILTVLKLGHVGFAFLQTLNLSNREFGLLNPANVALNGVVSRLLLALGFVPSAIVDMMRVVVTVATGFVIIALTISATRTVERQGDWRALSLWIVAMIVLSPTAQAHYLILLIVPFAMIADAARAGEAPLTAIYAAITSYLLTFSRYPITLLYGCRFSSVAYLRIVYEFWFSALVLAYLASYSLVLSRDVSHSARR
jgi:Glycosyltransferase family 87